MFYKPPCLLDSVPQIKFINVNELPRNHNLHHDIPYWLEKSRTLSSLLLLSRFLWTRLLFTIHLFFHRLPFFALLFFNGRGCLLSRGNKRLGTFLSAFCCGFCLLKARLIQHENIKEKIYLLFLYLRITRLFLAGLEEILSRLEL